MIELIKTHDPVRLSFLKAVLKDAQIESVVLDEQVTGLFGAAFGARLMVDDDDLNRARRLIAQAESGIEPS